MKDLFFDCYDWTLRLLGRILPASLLKRLIPDGDYCYRVLSCTPATANTPTIHQIAPCPFARGGRPDTWCILNPSPDFREDWAFNVDATKGCGINQADDQDL